MCTQRQGYYKANTQQLTLVQSIGTPLTLCGIGFFHTTQEDLAEGWVQHLIHTTFDSTALSADTSTYPAVRADQRQ